MLSSIHQAAWIAALAFLVSFFVLVALRNSAPRLTHNEKQAGRQIGSSSGQRDNPPGAEADLEKPKAEQKSASPDDAKSEKESTDAALATYTYYLTFFTAVLAAATVILSIATIGLWNYAAEQASDMKVSIDVARRAATAAIMGQRAFIQISPSWSIDSEPSQPLRVHFGTRMDNLGNNPAKNLRNYIGFKIGPGELPDNFDYSDDAKPIDAAGLLGPKGWLLGPHIPPDEYISADQISAMQQGKTNLYIYGWAKYFDGFPDTEERITKFCYRVRVTGNKEQPFVFNPYGRHNCADEGCNE